jgi:hypothetical protein
MDKGIRPYALARFTEYNTKRLAGEYGPVQGDWYKDRVANKAFRKTVLADIAEAFGLDMALQAPSHYNYALQAVKKETPELVAGLCRPDDKKGGRKKKEQPAAEGTAPEAEQDENAVVNADATPPEGEALDTSAFDDAAQEEEVQPPAGQEVFTVKKKSTGEVVAEGITFDAARELVSKAKAAKKAALYWV